MSNRRRVQEGCGSFAWETPCAFRLYITDAFRIVFRARWTVKVNRRSVTSSSRWKNALHCLSLLGLSPCRQSMATHGNEKQSIATHGNERQSIATQRRAGPMGGRKGTARIAGGSRKEKAQGD